VIIHQREIVLPPIHATDDVIAHFARAVQKQLKGAVPLRFAVPKSDRTGYHCEVAAIEAGKGAWPRAPESIFQFKKRESENADEFNVVLLVPTGAGTEIGGHAGDAGPVAKLLGNVCDRLILHPNVVNASDINEMPPNALYVEGSVICRLLMGTAGLQPVRANRLLVIMDAHQDESFVTAAINSVSAARATYGLNVPRVVVLDPPLELTARYTDSGSAAGEIEGLDRLCNVLDTYKDEYDAVAIASVIHVPSSYHMQYFRSDGHMVNPWGGVEAMLTHAVSSLYDIPSAHSPMLESQEIADEDPGIVDPRMAAEAVSVAFLQCIFKGLQRSPRIINSKDPAFHNGTLTASDVSCMVIPDGCLGLPTLAALAQGITVIAVKENKNLMRNNLADLPWQADKFLQVENYWEAAGVIAALRAGIEPASVRRPLAATNTVRVQISASVLEAAAKESTAAKAAKGTKVGRASKVA
jgi:hypothetical protein